MGTVESFSTFFVVHLFARNTMFLVNAVYFFPIVFLLNNIILCPCNHMTSSPIKWKLLDEATGLEKEWTLLQCVKKLLKKKKKALHLHHRLHVDDTREHLKGEVQLAEKEKQTNQWDFILQWLLHIILQLVPVREAGISNNRKRLLGVLLGVKRLWPDCYKWKQWNSRNRTEGKVRLLSKR